MRKRGKKGSVHINTDGNGCQLMRWTFEGKRQSEKFSTIERLKEIEYLISAGINPKQDCFGKSKRNDLEGLLNELLEMKEAEGIRSTTLDNYRHVINRVLTVLPYSRVDDHQAIRKWCLANLSPSVAKRFLQLCGNACRELSDSNPFQGYAGKIRETWQDGTQVRALTDEELEPILNHKMASIRNAARLMLLTGMRPSEAYGLQWGDVKEGYILIQRQAREQSKGLVIIDGLKTQRSRKFPLSDELKLFLRDEASLMGDAKDKGVDWVLCRKNGKKDRYYRLFDRWKRLMPERTTPYNLRDTFITRQIKAGIPVSIVAAWVGNSVSVIEKHYQDVNSFLEVKPK